MKTVWVSFLQTEDGPMFHGVFSSFLSVGKHFKKKGGVEKEGIGMACFEVKTEETTLFYTVQEVKVDEPVDE